MFNRVGCRRGSVSTSCRRRTRRRREYTGPLAVAEAAAQDRQRQPARPVERRRLQNVFVDQARQSGFLGALPLRHVLELYMC